MHFKYFNNYCTFQTANITTVTVRFAADIIYSFTE